MFCIVGLGNPEKKYENTRHNIGFDVIDAVADKYSIAVREKGFKALFGKGMIEGQRVILVKPQTYMNLSGESIQAAAAYYKLSPEAVLVIYDDINLDVGRLRVREKGSAGGHNGMKSIISCLGSDQFPRIRIGVGDKPSRMDLADYVLGRFPEEELADVREAIDRAARAAALIVNGQMSEAMNQFNGKKKQ